MKKIILALAICTMITLSACNNNEASNSKTASTDTSQNVSSTTTISTKISESLG